ncbi:hypothetical protein VTO42DRAFT_3052 [Malbranchea cinnamomea]
MADTSGTTAGSTPEEDPLIKALPPATDYLTYLTVLEYQLTPARLPILHKLLQDETLTANIGWDLVKLLLPMLPQSLECLQDVARLGNPREVILRVSDALMNLQAVDEEDDEQSSEDEEEIEETRKETPLHVLQFSALLSMLSVLHSRIKTKYPSRFVASSLHATLEAYTSFPTEDTTASFLEFLRSLSPKKRPTLPPRSKSDRHVATSTAPGGPSAPDPEAENPADLEISQPEEQALIRKFVQFGLVEALKVYILHCTDRTPPGMQWTLRLQEKFASTSMPDAINVSRTFAEVSYLKQRDITVGKFLALSRDVGPDSKELLQIILKPTDEHPPPWDFENTARSAEEIPLERHGCLLLLAARHAYSVLRDTEREKKTDIAIFPDLSAIMSNFVQQPGQSPLDTVENEPIALIDSLLSLATVAHSKLLQPTPPDECQFKQLIDGLSACTSASAFQQIGRVERVTSNIFHAAPNATMRFNVIRSILAEEGHHARESALRWLKGELISATVNLAEVADNPFTDASSFGALFTHIYSHATSSLENFTRAPRPLDLLLFVQRSAPFHLAALNLYFFLLKSEALRKRLELETRFNAEFRAKYLDPLVEFSRKVCEDQDIARVIGDEDLGENALAMARGAAAVIRHIADEIKQLMDE